MRLSFTVLTTALLATSCITAVRQPDPEPLRQQVMEAERAFAKTMADRDHAAFVTFVSEEAIFFNGETPIRGREAVAQAWRGVFEGPDAPFSWDPDRVEVLESGTLALSTGPVKDPSGKVIGRFNSIWRRGPSGEWRVVFDKGSPVCPHSAPGSP